MDKTFWQAIIVEDYAVPPDHTAADLVDELLPLLGSTDPELRDDIGYGIFVRWVLAGALTPDDLRGLLPTLQHNLTVGIGERNTDSVFLRAFSVLWLAVIAYQHNQQSFLTAAEIETITAAALDYCHAETDLRGYMPGKGWAHATAHTADLLDELVQNPMLDAAAVSQVLDAIADRVLIPGGTVYQHDEDDRLAVAVVSAFQRDDLTPAAVQAWLDRFGAWIAAHPRFSWGDEAGLHSAYLNTRHLLRSVFVRLHGAEDLPARVRDYAALVLDALKPYGVRM